MECKQCEILRNLTGESKKECPKHYAQCRVCRTDLTAENSYKKGRYCKPCLLEKNRINRHKAKARGVVLSEERKEILRAKQRERYLRNKEAKTKYAREYAKTYTPKPETLIRHKARAAERVPCPDCGKEMRRDGIKRHQRKKHIGE